LDTTLAGNPSLLSLESFLNTFVSPVPFQSLEAGKQAQLSKNRSNVSCAAQKPQQQQHELVQLPVQMNWMLLLV